MNDSDLFKVFVNWNTALLCLGIYLLTYVIRTVVESLWKDAKVNRFWREIFLPLGPIVNGAALGLLAKKFPLPMPIADSIMAKMMYGAACGIACGWVFSRFRSWFAAAEAEKLAKVAAAPAAEPAAPASPGPGA